MNVHVNEWYAVTSWSRSSLFFECTYLCDVTGCALIQVALFPGETGTAGPGQQ